MSPTPSPRRRAAWLFLQVSAAVLPALTAARLQVEMGGAGLEALEGRVFVSYAGPFVLLWSLTLGLRLVPAPAGSVPALSSRLLGALLFTSTALGLWFLQAPDLSVQLTSWWTLLFWLFGLAAPLGVFADRCRDVGYSAFFSLAILGGAVGLGGLLTVATSAAFLLPLETMRIPVVVGGIVFTVALTLLRSLTSPPSTRRALFVVSLVALASQGVVAQKLSHRSFESGYVTGLVALDQEHGKALVRLQRLSIPIESFVEIDLKTGETTELSRRTIDAGYAGNIRVELRRSSLAVVLGRHDGQRVCYGKADAMVCSGRLRGAQPYRLTTHPREARVLAARPGLAQVMDLGSGATWSYTEDEGGIRWPCFAEDDKVLFRVDRGTFPYAQLALSLVAGSSGVVGLPLGHELQCLARSSVPPEVRFIRGRRAESRPSRILGPGLPVPGLDLGFSVGVSSWSGDGTVLGLLYEKGWFHRFRLDDGFSEPVLLGSTGTPVLNFDGSRIAHVVGRGEEGMMLFVRALPSGTVLAEHVVQASAADWDYRGDLLLIQGWTLRRLDLRTGQVTDLFPSL